MKKKKFDHNYLILVIFCITLLYLIIPEHSIFGSKIDWISQHVVFPDYFRKLFYKTKNLFPNFALSLGAGQNIYNFSYYGLLNPLIMLSYLCPNISMKNYIILLNMILFILFTVILYYFFKGKTSKKSALITTLILSMASSVLYHFHKHFMFVDYLPFLVLGLIGVDKFFEKNEKSLLAFSTFMIIMISYYYSISAIITLCIYAVYKYIAQSPKIDMKKMFQKGLSFCVPIIIAIISSAVLILPTFYALKSGRSPTNKEMDILKLLLPNFNIEGIVYGNYSLGLTAISLLAIITGIISNKKEQKFLTYCLLFLIFLPLGIYILNGTLYVRNKILIPQIPLVGLLVAPFIEKIINKKIDLTKLAVMIIIVIAVALGCKYQNPAFYLDTLIILGIIVCYYKNMTNEKFLILIILIIPLITLLISNSTDTYMKEESINKIESIKQQEEIQKTLDQEQNIVRFNNLTNTLENVNHIYTTEYNQNSLYSSISNPLYKEFYEKIFNNALSYRNNLVLAQNNDILFQTFMGVKYIYSEKDAPVGYQKISKNIYQNKNVLPLFYGTDKIKNEKEFDTLSYPHNIGVLLNSVITKEKTTNGWTTPIQKITPQYEVKEISNIEIKKRDEYLRIKTTKQKGKIKLKLKEPLGKDILIVNIVLINRSSCEEGDLKININEISNVLTCKEWIYKNDNNVFHYVISSNEELDSLNITFSRGVYKIKSVDVYKLKYEDLMNLTEDKDKFIINQKESVGDQIIGTITMHNNGYFVSSIPYDKGFQVKVDGKKVKTKIVNKAFLGFPLKEGKHQIKITYSAPWFKEGLVVSILGILSFFSMLMIERKSRIRK